MAESEITTPSKSSTVFLRNFAKNWVLASLALLVLFSAVYFFLGKQHCPKAGECDAVFATIREIFGRMLLMGAAISALGGWGIYRAYQRMK